MDTTPKKEARRALGQTLIQELKRRNVEGYYFDSPEECRKAILDMMPKGCSVSTGGSETVKEIGLSDALKGGDYEFIDRYLAKTPEESRALYGKIVTCDYYFMSANAITLDGQLVNIDGNGNRVACLVQGPQHVMIVAGMNKVVATVEEGVNRTRNVAAPANAQRLDSQTPCRVTGRCGDCMAPASMCCHTVITRGSRHPGRIKVFLVGEDLGY